MGTAILPAVSVCSVFDVGEETEEPLPVILRARPVSGLCPSNPGRCACSV